MSPSHPKMVAGKSVFCFSKGPHFEDKAKSFSLEWQPVLRNSNLWNLYDEPLNPCSLCVPYDKSEMASAAKI